MIEAYTYKPIESEEDFYDRLTEAYNLICEKHKNIPKQIYDVLGNIYIYENDEDLKNIQLDEKTWKITREIANILM